MVYEYIIPEGQIPWARGNPAPIFRTELSKKKEKEDKTI